MVRRSLLAVAVVASVASLTACGGGVQSTIDPVAEAASKSSDAGGVKVSMNATFSMGSVTGGLTAEGVFDKDAGDLTIDLSNIAPGTPQTPALGELHMLYTTENGHTVVYAGLPALEGVLPGGKTWIKADVDRLAQLAGVNLGQSLGQATQNPADVLELLRAAGTVEEAGHDTIDGTPATLYHATIDLQKAAEAKGVPDELVQRMLDSGITPQIPVDVWIGDDGLLRQVRMEYDASSNGQPISLLLTMTLSDWGTDVTVEAPADEQVFDATELAGALGTR
jgi:hypothetical protein